jgi:hypothetical protein
MVFVCRNLRSTPLTRAFVRIVGGVGLFWLLSEHDVSTAARDEGCDGYSRGSVNVGEDARVCVTGDLDGWSGSGQPPSGPHAGLQSVKPPRARSKSSTGCGRPSSNGVGPDGSLLARATATEVVLFDAATLTERDSLGGWCPTAGIRRNRTHILQSPHVTALIIVAVCEISRKTPAS